MNASRPLLLIRPARRDDVPRLQDIERHSFKSDLLSPRQMTYHTGNGKAVMLVAADGRGTAAGYALILLRGRTARLYSLAVAPEHRGRGIAQSLMDRAIRLLRKRGCKTFSLEVRKADKPVIAFYEKNGFTAAAPLFKYYEDGADGIRMRLNLV